ncbi:MAG: M24 family metallopeptidase [Pirellulaceae bacterium]|nr:M24 family metallopeptidase [Pirellulaceae bacterium]
MIDLATIQQSIKDFGFDGWLLYDFRGINILALRVLGIPTNKAGSRRFFYFIPANGTPQKLVHRIEQGALDHLPGEKTVYLTWQSLEEGVKKILGSARNVAMEYSPRNGNPYISRVDAGTVELVRDFNVDVKSSGNLISFFESRWSEEQWQLHLEADRLNQAAFEMAWKMIADHVRARKELRETDVQDRVMEYYHENGMTTYSPPIVGVGPNSGDPHYSPQRGADAEIKKGDFVLLDMWAKMDRPGGVYSDLTKVGFVGDSVPEQYEKIFKIVAEARDASIALAREAFAGNRPIAGGKVDDAARRVIEAAGYGEYFVHRTGHNIGEETHGNGTHIDNLETNEERLLLPNTCFSIEPGIYLPEFGVRSEVNVYIEGNGTLHVTGGLQTSVLPILADI